MPSYVTPKINTEYILYISVVSQADTKVMQNSPTIAAGDFQVSTNGGALGNLATLPVVTPAASVMIKVTLSAGEMNGDNVTLVCKDAAGAEWCDLTVNIQTSAQQIDDLNIVVPDAAGVAPTTAEIATGVWTDIVAGDFTVASSIGLSVMNGIGLGTGLTIVSVSGAVGSVTGAVGSVSGHTNQTGDTFALANGASGFVATNTVVDTIQVKTDFLPSATAGVAGGVFIAGVNAATSVTTSFTTTFTGNLTGTVASVTGNVDGSTASVTGAVGSVTGSVGSVTGEINTSGGTIKTLDALDTAQDTQHANTQALLPGLITGTTTGGGSSTTLIDTLLTETDTDYWKGSLVKFTSGVCSGQTRLITGFNLTSDTITFAPAATQVIATSVTYEILPASIVEGISGTLNTLDALQNIAITDIVSDGTAINTTAGAVDTVTGLTALTSTTFGEPAQGIPGETVTMEEKISTLYKLAVNKFHGDAAGGDHYNFAGTVVDHKFTHTDDNVDYNKTALVSGP